MIYVVDSMMGTGKTSSMINYINQSDDSNHFIYITPYINEVERIIERCDQKRFKQPQIKTGRYKNGQIRRNKINDIRQLINRQYNIATTHALFSHFDDDIVEKCEKYNYTLVMDEVADVVQPYDDITRDDVKTLRQQFVDADENHILHWRKGCENYNGKYNKEKVLCDMGCLTLHGQEMFIWMFPVKIFKSFKDVYLLTYMFDSQIQKYYYDYYGMKYKYLYVKGDNEQNYSLTEDKTFTKPLYNYKQLITILDNDRMNKIGDKKTALSVGWYKRTKAESPETIKQMKANLINFFNNIQKSKSENNIWTTYEDFEGSLEGKGYKKGFLPCNTRATNAYANRHNIAYMINFYMNPTLATFFRGQQIDVNEDGFSLSEMIQFIWRSAIRKGEPVSLYIPSKRMRNLLIKWLDKIEKEYLNGQN